MCSSPPAHPLCLKSINKHKHHYTPRHDFISGIDNSILDLLSRYAPLSYSQLVSHFTHAYLHEYILSMWHPPSASVSAISSAMQRMTSLRNSLQDVPTPLMAAGLPGPTFVGQWNLTPQFSLTNVLFQF